MAYKIKGCYRVPQKTDFRNPQPITEINSKFFIMEFPDHIPFEEARKEVEERAQKLYEIEEKLLEEE